MVRPRERMCECPAHPNGPDAPRTKKKCIGEPNCSGGSAKRQKASQSTGRPKVSPAVLAAPYTYDEDDMSYTAVFGMRAPSVRCVCPPEPTSRADHAAFQEWWNRTAKDGDVQYAAEYIDPADHFEWAQATSSKRGGKMWKWELADLTKLEQQVVSAIKKARNDIVIREAAKRHADVARDDFYFLTNKMIVQLVAFANHYDLNDPELISVIERLWGWGPGHARNPVHREIFGAALKASPWAFIDLNDERATREPETSQAMIAQTLYKYDWIVGEYAAYQNDELSVDELLALQEEYEKFRAMT